MPASPGCPSRSIRSSSPVSDSNARFTVSSGFSATNPLESGEKASGMDNDRSVASQTLVQPGPEVMSSHENRPGNTDRQELHKPRQEYPYLILSLIRSVADSSGRSDIRNNARTDAAGVRILLRGPEGRIRPGIPNALGQSRESRGLAGMMIIPLSAAAARSAFPGARTAIPHLPGANHGPSPQRQHHGPPAQSGQYPCGPAQASPLPQASGQTREESKEETPSRQRSKRIGFLSWIMDPIVPDAASSSFPCSRSSPSTCWYSGVPPNFKEECAGARCTKCHISGNYRNTRYRCEDAYRHDRYQ